METIIKIVALLSILFTLMPVFGIPLAFGKSRGEYTYATWIASILEAIFVWLLALSVLGFI